MHERRATHDEFEVCLVESQCVFLEDPELDFNTCVPQLLDAMAVDSLVRVLHRYHRARDFRLYQGVATRWGAALVATRLQIAVQRRSPGKPPRSFDCIGLSMFQEIITVIAFADDSTVIYQHRSNHRVRAYQSGASSRQAECALHK